MVQRTFYALPSEAPPDENVWEPAPDDVHTLKHGYNLADLNRLARMATSTVRVAGFSYGTGYEVAWSAIAECLYAAPADEPPQPTDLVHAGWNAIRRHVMIEMHHHGKDVNSSRTSWPTSRCSARHATPARGRGSDAPIRQRTRGRGQALTERDDRTYIRIHDGMPEHWKVEDLSDSAFRLIITIWCWCARQRTDGFVPERKWIRFGSESDRTELLDAGLIEPAEGGVRCHDYLKHQRSRDAIRARSDASRIANHTRWHVKKKRFDPGCDLCVQGGPPPNRSDSDSDSDSEFRSDRTPTSSERMSNGVPDQIRGEQSRTQTDGSLDADVTGSQSVRTHAHADARAREAEAIRWLRQNYGLTDPEAAAVWEIADGRAATPVRHPVRYLQSMRQDPVTGEPKRDLADIVDEIQRAAELPQPEPELPQLRPIDGTGGREDDDPAQPTLLIHPVPDEPRAPFYDPDTGEDQRSIAPFIADLKSHWRTG